MKDHEWKVGDVGMIVEDEAFKAKQGWLFIVTEVLHHDIFDIIAECMRMSGKITKQYPLYYHEIKFLSRL